MEVVVAVHITEALPELVGLAEVVGAIPEPLPEQQETRLTLHLHRVITAALELFLRVFMPQAEAVAALVLLV
jgi:hypothetical protein